MILSLRNCFGASISCDNDNTVNNNISNGTNPPSAAEELGTLTVFKDMTCVSTAGSPSDQAVCDYAVNSPFYAEPQGYRVIVTANSLSLSSFDFTWAGNEVEMSADEYTLTKMSNYDQSDLQDALGAPSVAEGQIGATGD